MSEPLELVGVECYGANPKPTTPEDGQSRMILQFSTVDDGDYKWDVPDHLAAALLPLLFDDPHPDYKQASPVGIPNYHDPVIPRLTGGGNILMLPPDIEGR